MNEAKFKVGDLVTVSGLIGVVTDIMYSLKTDSNVFEVTLEGETTPCGFYRADEMELVPVTKDYSMTINIDIASNVVIATLYEETKNSKSAVAKGHGHMIHEGELGIAQAASYACKRLYESLGGTITKGGSWR